MTSVNQAFAPLAARMRPVTVEEYCGQQHLFGQDKPLRKMLESGHCHSMILWGPPGTGKTTLAELIAHYTNATVLRISAVTSGVKDIRAAMDKAQDNARHNQRTLLAGRLNRIELYYLIRSKSYAVNPKCLVT